MRLRHHWSPFKKIGCKNTENIGKAGMQNGEKKAKSVTTDFAFFSQQNPHAITVSPPFARR